MPEFYFLEQFYPVDFTNPKNKLRSDSQYLNNKPDIEDRSKSVPDVQDDTTGLKEMKIRPPDKLILGKVNINSIRNKFDSLIYMLDKNTYIFPISERNPMIHSHRPNLKQVSPPYIGIVETIKEVAFYCLLRRTFHHVYCNKIFTMQYRKSFR